MVGIEKPVHTEPYPNIMKTSSVKHWLVRFNKNQSITEVLSRFFPILEEKYIISQNIPLALALQTCGKTIVYGTVKRKTKHK